MDLASVPVPEVAPNGTLDGQVRHSPARVRRAAFLRRANSSVLPSWSGTRAKHEIMKTAIVLAMCGSVHIVTLQDSITSRSWHRSSPVRLCSAHRRALTFSAALGSRFRTKALYTRPQQKRQQERHVRAFVGAHHNPHGSARGKHLWWRLQHGCI